MKDIENEVRIGVLTSIIMQEHGHNDTNAVLWVWKNTYFLMQPKDELIKLAIENNWLPQDFLER